MPITRGTIVLAALPFSDGSGSKVRPGLVVQSDHNNRRLQDVVVALITKTVKNTSEPTQLLIDITTPEGRATRRLHTLAVKCEHLITIDQQLIQRTIGSLPPPMMLQIDACLKCQWALQNGSPALPVGTACFLSSRWAGVSSHPANSTRFRNRSNFALPNIWRFISFKRLTWPST
jgi:mRNA-degrading endonuclease toxin of MazEF toxin-antitoxin module